MVAEAASDQQHRVIRSVTATEFDISKSTAIDVNHGQVWTIGRDVTAGGLLCNKNNLSSLIMCRAALSNDAGLLLLCENAGKPVVFKLQTEQID